VLVPKALHTARIESFGVVTKLLLLRCGAVPD
jgi:hypothetical protein